MKRLTSTIWMVVVVFAAMPAMAQESRHEVFGGFSALSSSTLFKDVTGPFVSPTSSVFVSDHFNFVPGWQAGFAFNISANLAAVADFGGHYQTVTDYEVENGGILVSESDERTYRSHEFLFGPRLTARSGTVTGFIHYLAGIRNTEVEVLDGDASSTTTWQSGTNFAHAVGGGLDLEATDDITIRVIQLDFLMERRPEETRTSGALIYRIPDRWENSIRAAVGIVIGF